MSNYMYVNGELYHHGVLGMKWGVRKEQYRERLNIRRAAYALTDKRKDEFLKRAKQHGNNAKILEARRKEEMQKIYDNSELLQKGKAVLDKLLATHKNKRVKDL